MEYKEADFVAVLDEMRASYGSIDADVDAGTPRCAGTGYFAACAVRDIERSVLAYIDGDSGAPRPERLREDVELYVVKMLASLPENGRRTAAKDFAFFARKTTPELAYSLLYETEQDDAAQDDALEDAVLFADIDPSKLEGIVADTVTPHLVYELSQYRPRPVGSDRTPPRRK